MSTLGMSRISGIDIRVHWSFGIALVAMTVVFAQGIFARALPESSPLQIWAFATLSAVMFSSSILLHELSHSLVARHLGLPVAGITLFMFDGASKIGRPETARQECAIAIVGPITNLALASLFTLGLIIHPLGAAAAQACAVLAAINFFLAVFNMLPGLPMDGGRVLRSVIWILGRSHLDATRIVYCVAKYVSFLAVGAGLVLFLVNPLAAIIIAVVGNLMRVGSATTYKKLLLAAAA